MNTLLQRLVVLDQKAFEELNLPIQENEKSRHYETIKRMVNQDPDARSTAFELVSMPGSLFTIKGYTDVSSNSVHYATNTQRIQDAISHSFEHLSA